MVATFDLVLVIVYILLCLAIGFLASRKAKISEFLIAGRNLGPFRFISTYVASAVGGGTLVAYTAFVYKFGISALWGFVAYCLTIWLFIYYAKKIRAQGKKENWYTLPDFFFKKYGKGIGMIVSLLILFTSFLFLIGQLIAGSTVLSVATGWPYLTSLLLGASVVLVYLFLGGFNAVVVTDIFQYILMLFLTVVVGLFMTRGIKFAPEQLDVFGAGPGVIIGLILFGALTIVVSPELWQRIYAAKDDKTLKWGMPISALLIGVIGVALTLIVMATKVRFPNLIPEQALAYGFVNVLPPVLLGFGLVLLFATIMSSADTLIFALATIVGKNIFGGRGLKEKAFKKITRNSILGVTVFATLMAYIFPDIIKVYTIIANVVFSIAPATLGSFHWKLKKKAVMFSIGCGILTLLAFIVLDVLRIEIAALSFLISLVALIIGQKLFR